MRLPPRDNVPSQAPAGPDEFVLTQVLNGTVQQVWDAFTQAQQLRQWWGPHAVRTTEVAIDLRVGGRYLLLQEFDGKTYPLKGEFLEIDAPHKLVMTMDCSDHPSAWHDAVNPARGGNANPAGVMVMAVYFEAIDASGKTGSDPRGKTGASFANTRLTIRTCFESANIRNTLVEMGMNVGWAESLEKLDALVSGAAARFRRSGTQGD